LVIQPAIFSNKVVGAGKDNANGMLSGVNRDFLGDLSI